MLAQTLVQPTRLILRTQTPSASIRPLLTLRRPSGHRRSTPNVVHLSKRTLSTTNAKQWAPDEINTDLHDGQAQASPPEGPSEDPNEDADVIVEVEKVRRTRRTPVKVIEVEKDATIPLPPGLDILWTPNSSEQVLHSTNIPPPEILQDALTNLLITLHPQTQHRAVYASSAGPPIEPTLALYCPIEGADNVVDETVRELARRTDSDVITLDSVQLAAGIWGSFGAAASAIDLSQNPLHFQAPSAEEDGFEDDDDSEPFMRSGKMTITLVAENPRRSRRQGSSSSSSNATSRNPFTAKTKAFFDELVNIPAADSKRSRLIYIRDYSTLAASASSWYPALLASVRQRRQGPISRPTLPVTNNITIVFGMTPPFVNPYNLPAAGRSLSPQGMMGLMNSRPSSNVVLNSSPKSGRSDNGEDEQAQKLRERRLRDRLKRWWKNDPSFFDDLPRLPSPSSEQGSSSSGPPGVVVMGATDMGGLPIGLPPGIASLLQGRSSMSSSGGISEDSPSVGESGFFRISAIVPTTRNMAEERDIRIARRREINILTMRMAVGDLGGVLEPEPPLGVIHVTESGDASSAKGGQDVMWDEWGKHVEFWTSVKDIADKAMGVVLNHTSACAVAPPPVSPLLERTPVPWSAIASSWAARRLSRNARKAWIKHSIEPLSNDSKEDGQRVEDIDVPHVDDVIQDVKEDPDLTPHEQRLLGCIVDARSMPTSFSQVHLPPHTIDSVRTIVSLPLLHPSAFQTGILRQHSMTGCLLFGPPGTGKTLVVRALAKEAGCRMLAVAPSDVMDMYVGEGEKLVRSVFSLARRLSPCVIFLDEIDALFGARSSARETGGAMAHHGVITEFMQEMDGLKTNKDSNVIVIGATNRPFDLDDAVLRRLPRRLLVDLPGEKERREILKILLRDEVLAEDVDLDDLAKRADLFSGSDLKHLCVSAALDAVKEGVVLPWTVPKTQSPSSLLSTATATSDEAGAPIVLQEWNSDAETQTFDNGKPILQPTPKDAKESAVEVPPTQRILSFRHFSKALKEITPSSSEALGSLTALRKWNEEFGEGRTKKRRIMWGKGLFGFAEPGSDAIVPDGKVAAT